jgi:hypothetical protein
MNVPDDEKLAFPQSVGIGNLEDWAHGMLLRDYFAAAALTGLVAKLGPPVRDVTTWAEFATASYRAADAMFTEREIER